MFKRSIQVCKGKVFQWATLVAFPCAILSATLKIFEHHAVGAYLAGTVKDSAMYSSINFLIGFLIVFRTSTAYGRYWAGSTSVHQISAAWSDGASSSVCFSSASNADPELVKQFQQTLVRLLSLLNALILTELSCGTPDDSEEDCGVAKLTFAVLDLESLDRQSLAHIQGSKRKIDVVFQLLQRLFVENVKLGVLNLPPPLLSRVLQEFSTGMDRYEDCLKIVHVPLPFPYIAAIEVLLIVHWCISPVIINAWTDHWHTAAFMCFFQVFFFWCLNFTAAELENPFGTDAEDLDTSALQTELNDRLRIILQVESNRVPSTNCFAGKVLLDSAVLLPDVTIAQPRASHFSAREAFDMATCTSASASDGASGSNGFGSTVAAAGSSIEPCILGKPHSERGLAKQARLPAAQLSTASGSRVSPEPESELVAEGSAASSAPPRFCPESRVVAVGHSGSEPKVQSPESPSRPRRAARDRGPPHGRAASAATARGTRDRLEDLPANRLCVLSYGADMDQLPRARLAGDIGRVEGSNSSRHAARLQRRSMPERSRDVDRQSSADHHGDDVAEDSLSEHLELRVHEYH